MFAFSSNQTGPGRMVIIGGSGPTPGTNANIEYLTSAGTKNITPVYVVLLSVPLTLTEK